MINENKIKLSGMANLSKPPLRTNIFVDLTFKKATLTGDIDLRDNEDGTHDQIFKIKITPETEINILAENEIISARKKGSQSQVLRNVIKEYWEQQKMGDIEFEDYYKQEMSKIINEIKSKLL